MVIAQTRRSRPRNVSQAQAEAKQKALAREKQQQDAINSDTVAIDFAHSGGTASSDQPLHRSRLANRRCGGIAMSDIGARQTAMAVKGRKPSQVTTDQPAEV